jgi:hypothetical protein
VLIDKTKGVISNKKKRIGKLKTGFTVCRYKTSLVTKNTYKKQNKTSTSILKKEGLSNFM